jgi:methylglutamate dehydrogenase subunit D
MVDIASALQGYVKPGRHGIERRGQGITIREISGRDLVQVGWWPATGPSVTSTLSKQLGFEISVSTTKRVAENSQTTVFPIAPDRLWIAAPVTDTLYSKLSAALPADQGVVTDLGQSRTVIRIGGPSTRDVLARSFAIDLHPAVFPPGSFASSSLHHTGALLHYVRDLGGSAVFDIYLLRTFAVSLFESLCLTAEGFGYTTEA